VTDPLETGRQDVLQKAVDELVSRHVLCALLAAGGIGADTQQHVVAVDAENPLVGDRHSVRVAAEGLEHRFGTTEWLLRLKDLDFGRSSIDIRAGAVYPVCHAPGAALGGSRQAGSQGGKLPCVRVIGGAGASAAIAPVLGSCRCRHTPGCVCFEVRPLLQGWRDRSGGS
jgi:hypothetical protein